MKYRTKVLYWQIKIRQLVKLTLNIPTQYSKFGNVIIYLFIYLFIYLTLPATYKI